jgi:hypothetical protein
VRYTFIYPTSISEYKRATAVEPELLAFIPRPVLAVLMLFPSHSKGYLDLKKSEADEIAADPAKKEFGKDLLYFKQARLVLVSVKACLMRGRPLGMLAERVGRLRALMPTNLRQVGLLHGLANSGVTIRQSATMRGA